MATAKPKVSKATMPDTDDELEMARQPAKGALDQFIKTRRVENAEFVNFVIKNAAEYSPENPPKGVKAAVEKVKELRASWTGDCRACNRRIQTALCG